jgi:hypothetical protein
VLPLSLYTEAVAFAVNVPDDRAWLPVVASNVQPALLKGSGAPADPGVSTVAEASDAMDNAQVANPNESFFNMYIKFCPKLTPSLFREDNP